MNRVVLVGAGCGADSVTVRGARLLQKCDCVVYDSLLDESVFGFLRGDCVRIFVGKRAGVHAASQEEINAILCECAKKYPLTVRLKGGDPFVFGRGGEELAALAAQGISCGVVPGVTSAVAAAELAGIPVTHRAAARGFRVYTAHTADGTFSVPTPAADETLVFLMAKANAARICETLFAGGMSGHTPAALLSGAGMPGAEYVRCTLGEVPARAAELPAPLTLVVGRVCAEGFLGADFSRCFSSPAVLVTGSADHTARVSAELEARGFAPVPCAYVVTEPLPFEKFFRETERYRWLVFTSANGVNQFFRRAEACGADHRLFGGKKFAAIGAHTAAALAAHGFIADLVPAQYTAAALAAELKKTGAAREEVALLRAEEGSDALLDAGTQIPLYRTRVDEEKLRRACGALGGAKYVTFGSAGGARALLGAAALPAGTVPVCIGEETAKEVIKRGYAPVVAAECTAAALADAVARTEISCRD